MHRCWRKLYVKETLHLQGEYSLIIYNCYKFEGTWETFHLQGEYSLIIYNCCYKFEGAWAKVLQKAIF